MEEVWPDQELRSKTFCFSYFSKLVSSEFHKKQGQKLVLSDALAVQSQGL